MHLSRALSGQYTRSKLYAIHKTYGIQHEVHSFLSKYWNNHSTAKIVCQRKTPTVSAASILWNPPVLAEYYISLFFVYSSAVLNAEVT